MKRFLSLLAATFMLSSLTGCCCTQGCGGGGFNSGSYYQPYNYAPQYGGCPGGQCAPQGVPAYGAPTYGAPAAPAYPQGSLYGPTTAVPQTAPPVANLPFVPQTAGLPLQGLPTF